MDGADRSRAISVNGRARAKDANGQPILVKHALLSNYHIAYAKAGADDAPRTISYRQFQRYLDKAEELGIIGRERPGRQGPDTEHPNAWMPNVISVDFSKVLVGNKILPHNFFAKLPSPDEENDTKSVTRDVTRDAPGMTPGVSPSLMELMKLMRLMHLIIKSLRMTRTPPAGLPRPPLMMMTIRPPTTPLPQPNPLALSLRLSRLVMMGSPWGTP